MPPKPPHRSPAPYAALIIDDDSLARDLLRYHLGRMAGITVIGEAATLSQAMALLARPDYNIVFLDVQLPGGSGFDLLSAVRPDAVVIIISGRDDHAARAFEVNAADYLVKPVTAARLAESLRRVGAAGAVSAAGERIFLPGKSAGGQFVALRQVAAILSAENYSEVFLLEGGRFVVRRTMVSWTRTLPEDMFVRISRGAIVNLRCVDRVERADAQTTRLVVRGMRQPLAVGRSYWRALRARLYGQFAA